MSESLAKFRVLVGVDFSETSRMAMDYALDLCGRNDRPELHVASIVDDSSTHLLPPGDRHATLAQATDKVHELLTVDTAIAIERHGAKPGAPQIDAIVHVRVGAVAEQLTNLATEIRADLLVVGTHGRRGLRRLMMGSVAEHAVRLAPCPVLVVRGKNFSAMEGLPVIEPPCRACLDTREATEGAQWWCDGHSALPDSPHVYSFSGRLDPPAPLNHVL